MQPRTILGEAFKGYRILEEISSDGRQEFIVDAEHVSRNHAIETRLIQQIIDHYIAHQNENLTLELSDATLSLPLCRTEPDSEIVQALLERILPSDLFPRLHISTRSTALCRKTFIILIKNLSREEEDRLQAAWTSSIDQRTAVTNLFVIWEFGDGLAPSSMPSAPGSIKR